MQQAHIPLAVKLRPNNFSEIVGQQHLVGPNGILKKLVESHYLPSIILYGPPGTGKTTIANVIINELKRDYILLNAVINNKKDFDEALDKAKKNGSLILVVDEIHRLNKDKQDILLPYLESGLITLIGLTSSNPYHKINQAIRSRCQIFELKELTLEDAINALDKVNQVYKNIIIDDSSKKKIALLSNGDIRYAYSLLETAYLVDNNITVSLIERIAPKANIYIDSNDDNYYDVISALQKSIRGSDADAALHYLARLLESGNLDIIYRRLTVIAYEDIGLANPSIGPKVDAVINACERLGLPEARIPLGDLVIEMALSPKSNSGHIALDEAIEDIRNKNTGKVPNHLQTNSSDYLYPHNYLNHFVKQQYLPDNLIGTHYYKPAPKDVDGLASTYNRICKIQDQS